MTLYNALVRSKLDYSSVVWSPIYNFINRLEAVQRRFLKFIAYKIDRVYPQRGTDHNALLNRFDFLSLKHDRECSTLVFLFKLGNGLVDCPELLEQLNFHIPD